MGDSGHASIVREPASRKRRASARCTNTSCCPRPRKDSLQHVAAGVVERDVTVRLGENVDHSCRLVLLVEKLWGTKGKPFGQRTRRAMAEDQDSLTHVLIVGEVVSLDLGLGNLIEVADRRELRALSSDLENELGVGHAAVEGSGTVGGGLDLETNVKDLTGDEFGLWWTRERRVSNARRRAKEIARRTWSGGKMQPSVGL